MDINNFDKLIKETPELSKLFDDDFRTAMVHAVGWGNTQIKNYKNKFCLKELKKSVQEKTINSSLDRLILSCQEKDINVTIADIKKVVNNMDYKSRCCLPKNHKGACLKTLPWGKVLSKSKKSYLTQLDWVYNTPGNNDFIFKNRSSRLFPIKLSDTVEKKIRDKNIKRKCAIPLKDGSSPLMAVTCYIDLCSYLLRTDGFWNLLNFKETHIKKIDIKNMFNFYKKDHFKYISNKFLESNRKISKKTDKTVLCCPVRGSTIKIEDLVRDIKDDLSIQFGHVIPRSNTQMMTRGQNVVLMTRRGNLLIGDHNFLSDTWLTEIKRVLEFNK